MMGFHFTIVVISSASENINSNLQVFNLGRYNVISLMLITKQQMLQKQPGTLEHYPIKLKEC
jgi:hypothetical protein